VAAGYLVAMSIFAGAHETSVSLDVRVYVCLCAALLAWLLFAVTLHQLVDCKALTAKKSDLNVLLSYGSALFVPLTHVLRSSLLGFIAVGVVHSWLGFGIWSFFGGYGAVGSSDRDRTKRSIFASVVILLALVISRLPGGRGSRFARFLVPFETGLQCFGSVALYLALLIRANPFNNKDSKCVVCECYRRFDCSIPLRVYFVLLTGAVLSLLQDVDNDCRTSIALTKTVSTDAQIQRVSLDCCCYFPTSIFHLPLSIFHLPQVRIL
jgi:hypothetical protein